MSRSKRIKVIHDIAAREETLMAQQVSDKLFDLQSEERRLEQLVAYLEEYRQLAADEHDSVEMSIIRGRRQFVERLQVCVRHQQALVESLCDQLERQMEEWNQARSKSTAIQRFAERTDAQQQTLETRREQARLDEVGRLQFAGKT
ncbi:MAG: flagellar export protein FliJ [Gammaproteobacteria bacterium]